MKKTFLASVLAGAIFLTGVCNANADTLTWTDSAPEKSPKWTDTFSGAKFNSGLGTLNSVDIKLWGNVDGYLEFLNATSIIRSYDEATLGTKITVFSPSGVAINNVIVKPTDLHSYNSSTNVPANSSVRSEQFKAEASTTKHYTDLLNLSLFTGPGNIDLLVESIGIAGFLGENELTVSSSSKSAASIEVTYDYTPTAPPIATPEPSTLMLLGGSLVGLAFWRRRKQK